MASEVEGAVKGLLVKGFVKEAKDGGVGVFGWVNWSVRRTRRSEASETER